MARGRGPGSLLAYSLTRLLVTKDSTPHGAGVLFFGLFLPFFDYMIPYKRGKIYPTKKRDSASGNG
jgi:hypothetical protein